MATDDVYRALPKRVYVRWSEETPFLEVSEDPECFAVVGVENEVGVYELVRVAVVTAEVKVEDARPE